MTVRIEPKRNAKRFAVEGTGGRRQHDARGEARVEEEREGLVAGGPAAGAQPLDRRPRRRLRRRGRSGRARSRAGSRAATPANAVWPIPSPIEAHAPLYEEEPDGRREQADDCARGEREPHELYSNMGVRRVVP